jgi:hypothetical protein
MVSICVARETIGRSCNNDTDPCVENLRCDANTRVCADRVPARGQCTSDDDCALDAPYCDKAANNICTSGLSFGTGASDCQDYGAPKP